MEELLVRRGRVGRGSVYNGAMRQVTLMVDGMVNDGDSQKVQAMLHEMTGVAIVNAAIRGGQVRVVYDSRLTDPDRLSQALHERGYEVRAALT